MTSRLRVLLARAALVLLVEPALAQAPAIFGQELLAAELESAKVLSKQITEILGTEKPDLSRLQPLLRLSSPPDPATASAWLEAVNRRVKLLEERQATPEQMLALSAPEAAPEKIQEMLDEATKRLRELRDPTAPPPKVPAELKKEDLDTYRSRIQQAQATLEAAETTLQDRQRTLAALEAEQKALPARTQTARQAVESLDETTAEDRLGRYRLANAKLDLAAAEERQAYLETARSRTQLRIQARQARRDVARAELEAEQKLLEAVQKPVSDLVAAEIADQERRAAQARAAAEREKDPVEKLRKMTTSERETVLKETGQETLYKNALQDQVLPAQVKSNDRFQKEEERLQERFEIASVGTRRTAEILLRTKIRVQEALLVLRTRTIPQLEQDLEKYQLARIDVLDRLFELDPFSEEAQKEWDELASQIPPERQEEAHRVFLGERDTVSKALAARRDQLDEILSLLGQLQKLYAERLTTFEDLYTLIIRRIYWVRSDDPIGLATLQGIPAEIAQLVQLYTGPKVRSGVATAYREAPIGFLGVGLALVVFLAGGVIVNRRLRHYQTRWKYRGGRLLVTLQRTGISILLSSLAPLCLLLAALLLGVFPLPDVVHVPGKHLLVGVAVILFARRFLWTVFREEGIAKTELGTPEPVADQLLRASHRLTGVAVFLYLPWWILEGDPLRLVHVPRVLYALLLLLSFLILIGLLGRGKPLLASVTGKKGFWYRAWLFVNPLLALGLLTIVGMDVLGYRFGARLLTANVAQTFLVALVLIGFYNLLTNLVEGAARKVFLRRRAEGETAEAYEASRRVLSQLTRFAGVVVMLLAVFLLAKAWGLLEQTRTSFGAIQLTEVDAAKQIYLTLWDVLSAVVWIAGAHFFLRNLSAILEVTLFPRLEDADAGTRFVIQTIARYTILVVAYGAALLTLHVSFASLGWLLAAASFGLGFGLQEIIANFVSGLILLLERPVRVGDIITVGDTAGTVKEINIRATAIENWDRQIMIVPNRSFITQNVINWTHNDTLMRTSIHLGVAYGTDVEKTIRVLLEIVRSDSRIVQEPAPRVLFLSFGESSLDLRIWYFTQIKERMAILSEIQTRIAKRFEEEGITIPFPQRDLWIRSVEAPLDIDSVVRPDEPGATPEGGGAAV